MRIPTGGKNYDPGDPGGGVNMATGLPFAPNVQTTSPSATTTTVKPTREYLQGIERGQQAYSDQAAAAGDQNAAQVDVAQHTADLYKGRAAADEAYQQERAGIRAEHTLRIQQAHQQYDERYRQAVQAQDNGQYWDDKSSQQKTMARIGILLSAVGAGISGGDNKAISYINDQVKQDADRKAQRAQRLMQLAEQSKGALSDAYRQRSEELSDVDLNYATGMKIVANQADTYAKTVLPKELQAQGAEKVAVLHNEAAKAYQDAHEKLNQKVEAQSGHTVTTAGLGKEGAGMARVADADKAAMATEMGDKAKEFSALSAKGAAPSAEQLADYFDRENKMVGRQKKESESTLQSALGSAGRATGLLPTGTYPKDWSEDNRRYWQLKQDMMHAYKVSQLGGSSGLNTPEGYQHFVSTGMTGRGVTPEQSAKEDKDLTRWALTQERYVQDATKTGLATQAKGSDQAVQNEMGGAPSSASRTLAPKVESIPDLIAKGRALKAAGDVAGARAIHDKITKQLGGR